MEIQASTMPSVFFHTYTEGDSILPATHGTGTVPGVQRQEIMMLMEGGENVPIYQHHKVNKLYNIWFSTFIE